MLSFWEKQSFVQYDVVIVGGGLVGLSTACELLEKQPKLSVAILEKGILPTGASTKNAGFACFGSPTELWSDAEKYGWDYVLTFVEKRLRGLEKLANRLGKQNIELTDEFGGYEILQDEQMYILDKISTLNELLKKIPFFQNKKNPIFEICSPSLIQKFGFQNLNHLIYTSYESQLHTGKMMKTLYLYAQKLGISIFTGVKVIDLQENEIYVQIKTEQNINFVAKKTIVCNNAFINNIYNNKYEVRAGRGQVLITKPLKKLLFRGNFHLEAGYFYFRNIGNDRVLLGGGRNLDFEGETTQNFEITEKIQKNLEEKLENIILPNQNFEIEQRWAGIMAFTPNHQPIIENASKNIIVGVALNGMGVAIGSKVGEELAEKVLNSF
jgi:glycine/D-amino acid oxidase-like deaminating enzyme